MMVDEAVVKAKYPDAYCITNKRKNRFVIITGHNDGFGCHTYISDMAESPAGAWADAARKLDGAK
jgi:hypothetical protein